MPEKTLHIPLTWAQRSNLVYLTLNVEDFKPTEMKVEGNKFKCSGVGGASKQQYTCEIEFYGDVDGEKIDRLPGDHAVALVIHKKLGENEEGCWWPRLLKVSGKVPWIKTDFNKWKDEDDESSADEMGGGGGPGGPGGMGNFDMNSMLSKMGGMGGMGGMPGMGAMGGMPGMGDFGDEDSDAEDLPDLEDGGDDEEDESAPPAKAEAAKPEAAHAVAPSTSGEA